MRQFKQVLLALQQGGLTTNPRKCHLGLTKAQYLGYHIGQGLLKSQDKKTVAVK